jgi:hypothetical protein
VGKKKAVTKDELSWWEGITHFKPKDFACRCGCTGSSYCISEPFVRKLDEMVRILHAPVKIVSGVRCLFYQERTKHGLTASSHCPDHNGIAHAVDVAALSGEQAYRIVAAAVAAGIPGIGIGGETIHLDDNVRNGEVKLWLRDKRQ